MASALRLSCQSFNFSSWQSPARVDRFQILCSNLPHSAGAGDSQCIKEENEARFVLLEKYGNGTSKRFILESDLQIRTILEDGSAQTNVMQNSDAVGTDIYLSWLPKTIKDFILPAGFPDSVSDDYLEYILLQFPTNVTGWICHTLVTSTLLKAVGVGSFSGTTAAASAAAIRWVSKDGIGALGRLFIGGRFGNLFDDDPKQWRLYADFVGSAGSIFDLSTQLYPAYFLPLASLGNLAKAVGRGLRDPSFRVIQNHFAISGNLGEVSAKEEVWEVAAELVGLALGILALINLKRARILVNSHISWQKIPGISDCNKMENILLWERFLKPKITFGVPLEEMINGKKPGSLVKTLLKLYAEEKYFLVVNQLGTEFEIFVSYKEGATSLSVLRSVWQSYWLHQNRSESDDVLSQLEQSLIALNDRFDDFVLQLERTGWETNQIYLKVPKEITIQEQSPAASSSSS
ncbi:protein root UVB sensitive 5 isoform X2 [Salvia miltiorrhiza]|uniref:protein root UVB sensitive 5 isoform X2 n=1 Tax=Salvia miltiorrhiza TaxID=226208 RepID=UPI0025AD509C|nr:protein root UVB sensitive 5 isoform X2 [Salvia miltiorrhiza]